MGLCIGNCNVQGGNRSMAQVVKVLEVRLFELLVSVL